MILLDRPYVSSFLLQSLQQHHIVAIDTPALQTLQLPEPPETISSDEAVKRFANDPASRLLCNSEHAINWISENLGHTSLPDKIRLFKDKCAFRTMLKDSFPDFFYTEIAADQLSEADTTSWPWPIIVKPAIGFFSMAVHRVENADQWLAIVEKICQEIEIFRTEYPQQVLDASRFIIEQCIEGEEYAVDAYYNDQGEPVILNILHHRFTSGDDVSDRNLHHLSNHGV